MRAVIYARYSTDLQSSASIDDQVRLCRERIGRDGHALTQVYNDRAVSGASLMRPGIQMLMPDANRGVFDIVYAEALDRISRDQEDVAGFFKRMRFADVKIITLAEGEITELHVGLKGTMNALFLKDLADKTRRGLRGRVEAGRSGGGNSYGYEVVRTMRTDGMVETGERCINQREAAIVLRIFREYSQGVSPREIAKRLNRDTVVGPSGTTWSPSTINGNRERGTGILNNELYIGKLVWNRLRYMKDPVTGKRRSRLNPEKDWIVKEVPELRILPQELWEEVKARQIEMAPATRPDAKRKDFWELQRPRYLLSGLMKCGCCGASYTKYGLHRFGCAGARDRATCTNHLTIHIEAIEAAILAGLKERLMEPALFEEFVREFTVEVNRQRSAFAREKETLQGELARVTKQIDKLVEVIMEGADALAVNAKLKALEGQKAALEDKLVATPDAGPLLHPALATVYRDMVERLEASLRQPDIGREASELIRGLIDAIILTPVDGKLEIELHGDLAGILAISEAGKASTFYPKEKALQIKMVAGARNQRCLHLDYAAL
ncbi:MAG: recombinase family protein [Methyloceanibacter sp.]